MDTLLYKPDWAEAKRRWAAFWEGERLDRPCMLVTAPRDGRPLPEPPADPERRWTDIDYLIAHDEARHSSTHYLAEAVPHASGLMLAWSAAYGAPVEYRPDTVWIGQLIRSWDDPPDFERGWEDDGWRRLKKAVAAIAAHAHGRYFVGMPPMLVPNDLLCALRGPLDFLADLRDCPERIEAALRIMRRNLLRMYRELADILDAERLGYGNWWPFWSPAPFYAPQSDVSCMLSREMFERFIIPELEELCRAWPNVFYHLDGPGALHHLDRLLELDFIKGIQWVPGAGQPGGWEAWRELYVKVAEAGKRVWFGCAPEQVEEVICAVPPERLLLSVHAGSPEEGEALLEAAARWTAEYWSAGRH
jgi:hypothetical protein